MPSENSEPNNSAPHGSAPNDGAPSSEKINGAELPKHDSAGLTVNNGRAAALRSTQPAAPEATAQHSREK